MQQHLSMGGRCAFSHPLCFIADSRCDSDVVDDFLQASRDRDRRRRTNVLMEDANDVDHPSTVHFLTPELAARSALFRG